MLIAMLRCARTNTETIFMMHRKDVRSTILNVTVNLIII